MSIGVFRRRGNWRKIGSKAVSRKNTALGRISEEAVRVSLVQKGVS